MNTYLTNNGENEGVLYASMTKENSKKKAYAIMIINK